MFCRIWIVVFGSFGGCASHSDGTNEDVLEQISHWIVFDKDVAFMRTAIVKIRHKYAGRTLINAGIPNSSTGVRFE